MKYIKYYDYCIYLTICKLLNKKYLKVKINTLCNNYINIFVIKISLISDQTKVVSKLFFLRFFSKNSPYCYSLVLCLYKESPSYDIILNSI